MFKRAIPDCTPKEQARQDKCRLLGCIHCRSGRWPGNRDRWQGGCTQIHHQTINGRQINQKHTLALCEWHHMATCLDGFTSTTMMQRFGPSLKYPGPRSFHEYWGDDGYQLRHQNSLLRLYP
jgi:hypothetical protein